MSSPTRLHALHEAGQSPWMDNLRRGWLTSGELAAWVERGIRGLTSNPSIFQKAISSGTDYDEQFGDLVGGGMDVTEAYWALVSQDIEGALALLRPVYDASDGVDGYVSVEVAPDLARDTAGTEAAARHLHRAIDEPNLYVKIPGTAEGVPAIQTMIAEGRSINVTLIFSLDRYAQVMEAYLTGLELGRRRPQPHLERGQLLHLPRRHRGRPASRRARHGRRARAPGPRRRGPGAGRLRGVPGDVRRSPVGCPRGPGRPGAAPALGLHLHQEPGVPRHLLRRPASSARTR